MLGIFINRKNVIVILMSVELILLAVNINLVAFSAYLGDLSGQVFALFVLTVAAAEAAIGLAILVIYFRNRGTIAVEEINLMKGWTAMYMAIVFLPLLGSAIAGLFGRLIGARPSELVTTVFLFTSAAFSCYAFYDVAIAGTPTSRPSPHGSCRGISRSTGDCASTPSRR